MKKTVLTPVVLVVILVAGLTANVFAQDVRQQLVKESALEQILQRGVLKVGMSTFVPWAMKDKNGEFVGFEIDVARRLAADMGVEVEFVPTKWSGIIPALLTGKFDVIIGGMGIRPDRNIKVNFSLPYDYSGMSIVANKENAGDFDSVDDFNKAGVAIAARTGTTAAGAVKKYMPEAQLKLFDNEAQTIQELLNGRVHAVVASAPFPTSQAIKYADRLFLPLEETFTKEPIGFAVRKSDFDTMNYFNNWILVVTSEGWLTERHNFWFRTEDWKDMVQ